MSAAESFLIRFHRAHPGCTSQAYAQGRIDGGGSSYDVLADCVPDDLPEEARVLDLGCGDGHLLELLVRRGWRASQLLGVDLSAEELGLARDRAALHGARLMHGRAQELDLPDASVHAVLSHLAFMLMDQPERVLAQVTRVLAPGGVFATVVGGGPKVGDAFELFIDLLLPIVRRVGAPLPRLGDRRCRTEQGLNELLGPAAGFVGLPRIQDFAVDLGGPFEAVWLNLSTMYDLYELPADALEELRTAFAAATRGLGPEPDRVPCSMFVRCARAVRQD